MLTMRDLASRLSETEFGTDNNTQVARAGGHQVSGGVEGNDPKPIREMRERRSTRWDAIKSSPAGANGTATSDMR